MRRNRSTLRSSSSATASTTPRSPPALSCCGVGALGNAGRARRVELAGFVFAPSPGHNIPLLGGTPGAMTGAILLLLIVAVSTFVLVEAHARLSQRR